MVRRRRMRMMWPTVEETVMRSTPLILSLLCVIPLAACSGGRDDVDNATANVAEAMPGNEVTAAPPGEPRRLGGIPEGFLGAWNFALEDCGDAASEGKLVMAADAIEYYESAATVEAVSSTSPGSIVVTAGFSGEGETWTERLAYELNATGDRLTTTTEDGNVSVRMRCPAA